VSPILLAPNSKTGIFEIFTKEQRKFVTFKSGILGGPVIKVTTKIKLHEGNQLDLPHAALSCKSKGYDF